MECMIGLIKRKHANRQPFGTDADSDLERPVLARQPRQGAGLCETRVGAIASVVHSLGENYGAEGGRRQEHRLAVSEMRRDQSRDNGLSEGRGRAQDQLGTADGFGDDPSMLDGRSAFRDTGRKIVGRCPLLGYCPGG